MKTPILLMMLAALGASPLHADDDKPEAVLPAANAINALGVDLLAKTPRGQNALISPYSIESALAMTYAGAAGKTRDEMAVAIHLPREASALDASFSQLRQDLERSQKNVARDLSGDGDTNTSKTTQEPALVLSVANRLYGQTGYAFRAPFLSLMKESYNAPMQEIDFAKAPGNAVKTINDWVSSSTHDRIKDLIPGDAITAATRLVLVNAIYFKGVWEEKFEKSDTKPGMFHVNGGKTAEVPMMYEQTRTYYLKRNGYTAVTLSYIGGVLNFVVILPDDSKGLPALEAKLTPAMLGGLAWPKLGGSENIHAVKIWLPKFKLEPPVMELSESLKALGMKTAFNDPKGSANFDGIAPRKENDYLFLSAVFHKTFLSLDESGTEAAGATAVVMEAGAGPPAPEVPKEMHVDHPFLFAIQDSYSGACLFLGRVTDPR